MPRLIGLPSAPERVGIARVVTGSPVAADNATLTDANISPTTSATLGGAMSFVGLETVLFSVELAGGSSPSVELDLLVRDEDAADGSRWKRTSATRPVLDGTKFEEVEVFGSRIFPRLHAVTGSPTSVTILIKPGRYQIGKGPFR